MAELFPHQIEITPELAGRPLSEIAATLLGDAQWAAAVIAHGGLWVDTRRERNGDTPAQAGVIVRLKLPPSGIYPQAIITPSQILYEDEDLIAINKPAGSYVEATPWDAENHLRGALTHLLIERNGTAPYLHLAHRLDRDTTGVLLFSRNQQVNAALQHSFEHSLVSKEYIAACMGEPAEDSFTLETGHGRSKHGRFRIYPREQVGQRLPIGGTIKLMCTRFSVTHRLSDATILSAFPITGRTHQIRLHLAHLGHPLLGDSTYGGPTEWRGIHIPRHLLHALRMELPHPRSGLPLILTAPDPISGYFTEQTSH